MFACIIILILVLFLPAAVLPCTLNALFSSRELNEMGIRLEDTESTNLRPNNAEAPSASYCLCV